MQSVRDITVIKSVVVGDWLHLRGVGEIVDAEDGHVAAIAALFPEDLCRRAVLDVAVVRRGYNLEEGVAEPQQRVEHSTLAALKSMRNVVNKKFARKEGVDK